jgi:hypothetical protein
MTSSLVRVTLANDAVDRSAEGSISFQKPYVTFLWPLFGIPLPAEDPTASLTSSEKIRIPRQSDPRNLVY